MMEFLAVLAGGALFLVCLLVLVVWMAVRRIRRSRLVALGTQAVADGALALSAARLRPTPNRAAALQAVRISREQRRLHLRVIEARRAGLHLGDVPALLPRLEAEGRRLRAGLCQLVGSTAAGDELRARADRHLATLADVSEAVAAAARVPGADSMLARDAEDAALGLRLHAAAYAELMANGGESPVVGSGAAFRVNAPR
jgi:hypothetical protein